MDVDHCALDDVGSRALNDRVDGNPLRQTTLLLVPKRGRIAHPANGSAAAGDRAYIATLATVVQRLQEKRINSGVAGEVAIDELSCVGLVDPQAIGQSKRALAIDDAEVHGFRA